MKKTGTTFWHTIPAPLIGLSPMDGVTDFPYRFIQKKYGTPSVVYTEFTNVEGLCHGAERLLEDFLYDETQRPVVAQIYGVTPSYFRQVAAVLCELGFEGIDINMGCPAKNVASSGAGAALIENPTLAIEIVRAVKAGINDYRQGKRASDCTDISNEIATEVATRHEKLPLQIKERTEFPVSIKTRVGYSTIVVEEWISTLLELEPAAIALHGRTLKQQYSGFASWEAIGQAAQLAKHTSTLLIGNGDIESRADAKEKITTYELDGVLIGRASFGNPYVFCETEPPNAPSIFEIALEHCRLYETTYSHKPRYNFLPMRKHLGWYVKNIPAAKEIRAALFTTNQVADVEMIFREYNLLDQ